MPFADSNRPSLDKIALLLISMVLFGCLFLRHPVEAPKSGIITQDEKKGEQEKYVTPVSKIIAGSIPEKSTLYTCLHGAHAPQGLVIQIIHALQPVFDLRYSSPGDTYSLEYLPPDTLLSFEYRTSGPDKFLVVPKGDTFVASKSQKELDRFIRCVRGGRTPY